MLPPDDHLEMVFNSQGLVVQIPDIRCATARAAAPRFPAGGAETLLEERGADTLLIKPGRSRENGYAEGFRSPIRDELLDGELSSEVDEEKYVVEGSRMHYNHQRPHCRLGYLTPAGYAGICRQPAAAGRVRQCPMRHRTVQSSQRRRTNSRAGSGVGRPRAWRDVRRVHVKQCQDKRGQS
jgi:hypothetical protein